MIFLVISSWLNTLIPQAHRLLWKRWLKELKFQGKGRVVIRFLFSTNVREVAVSSVWLLQQAWDNDEINIKGNMKRKRSSGLNSRQKQKPKHYSQLRNIQSKAIKSHNRLSKVNGKHLTHMETRNMHTEQVLFNI